MMFKYNPNIYIADLNETAVYDAIEHARKCFPLESCGIIVDEKFIPLKNESKTPEKSFQIKDQLYFDLYIEGKIECLVHSHNDCNYASFIDQQQQQESEIPWLIINIKQQSLMDCIVLGKKQKADLDGRPFFYGVFDCISLVSDYHEIKTGQALPQPPHEWAFWEKGEDFFENVIENDTTIKNLVEVSPTDLRDGDLIFYNIFGTKYINHVGIVDEGLVWHHMVGRPSGRFPKSYNRKYLKTVLRAK